MRTVIRLKEKKSKKPLFSDFWKRYFNELSISA